MKKCGWSYDPLLVPESCSGCGEELSKRKVEKDGKKRKTKQVVFEDKVDSNVLAKLTAFGWKKATRPKDLKRYMRQMEAEWSKQQEDAGFVADDIY